MQILEELRKVQQKYLLETIRRSQERLENSIEERKVELKGMNTRTNNTEE